MLISDICFLLFPAVVLFHVLAYFSKAFCTAVFFYDSCEVGERSKNINKMAIFSLSLGGKGKKVRRRSSNQRPFTSIGLQQLRNVGGVKRLVQTSSAVLKGELYP